MGDRDGCGTGTFAVDIGMDGDRPGVSGDAAAHPTRRTAQHVATSLADAVATKPLNPDQ
jgi:hypothetical protein